MALSMGRGQSRAERAALQSEGPSEGPSPSRDVNLNPMPLLAVIDCETTGLASRDRIVEIAVVVLDPNTEGLDVVDEYDTLVNPQRDVGPVHVHGITPSMVEAAPTFAEIAGDLATRLNGHVLVAHNLPFDLRMLASEIDRLGAAFDPGEGICTYKLSGTSLSKAVIKHSITLDDHHRAIADARASAEILRKLYRDAPTDVTAATLDGDLHRSFRTLRRDAFSIDGAAVLARVCADAGVRAGSFDRSYLETLDWMLDDFQLDDDERGALQILATHAQAGSGELADLHDLYFDAFVAASMRDGIISELEHATLERLATLLEVPMHRVPPADDLPGITALSRGMRVCFTGTAVDERGHEWARSRLEATAIAADLIPVESVTRSACDLVVAADPSSSSGKARKARDYAIPVISVDDFVALTKSMA